MVFHRSFGRRSGDVLPAERIDAYLQRGPEMLSFVLKNARLKVCRVPQYSDYYPEARRGPGRAGVAFPRETLKANFGKDDRRLVGGHGAVA
jgi:3-oxosteroid 1-dehydrogenase